MSTIDAEAERVYDQLGRGEQTDVKTIRAALLAAEKRGKEDAAKIADAYADRAEKAVPPAWEAYAAARNLAAAIRGS